MCSAALLAHLLLMHDVAAPLLWWPVFGLQLCVAEPCCALHVFR